MVFKTMRLGDVLELRRGFDLPKSKREKGCVPVYSSSGISGYHSVSAVDGPCLVTGRCGTIGQVFYSEKPCWPLNTSLYATEFKGNNSRFLYYFLKTLPWESYATASAVPGINRNHVNAIPVCLPDLECQVGIASLLGALDDKIALNNQLNGYLEELLFAKYDELFPAESEHDGTLADIGTVVGGATPSKKRAEYYCENGIGWITPRDLSNSGDKFIAQGAVDLTEEGYSSCSVKLLPAGSVLFSSRAPIGYVAIAAANVTTNQGFKSIVPKEEFGTAFVYCFLVRNKKKIADMGAGTTFPEVSGSMMRSVPLSLPSGQLCAEFSAFAHPILEQQRSFELENRNLCLLRDTLLPKLMSGKIDVSKVDLTQLNSHLAQIRKLNDAPLATTDLGFRFDRSHYTPLLYNPSSSQQQ